MQPEASVRQVLRNIFNNQLSQYYYNSMKRIENLYGREALHLLKAVFHTEAVLEDSSASQRIKMLSEDIFILINRNADLLEDVLADLNTLFRGLTNCTTTILYLSAILYGCVSFLEVGNIDVDDAALLEKHMIEFVDQININVSMPYFSYSADAFRLCLTLSILESVPIKTTQLLQQILARWVKFTTLK